MNGPGSCLTSVELQEAPLVAPEIGFTGTQEGMSEKQHSSLRQVLAGFFADGARVFRHGDCVGADAQAHANAKATGFRVVIHPPSDDSAKGRHVPPVQLPRHRSATGKTGRPDFLDHRRQGPCARISGTFLQFTGILIHRGQQCSRGHVIGRSWPRCLASDFYRDDSSADLPGSDLARHFRAPPSRRNMLTVV